MRLLRGLSVVALLAAASACSSPAQQFAQTATRLGMQGTVVRGTAFEHAVFSRPRASSRTLHVYLDGDGTPWELGRPAADPTPRKPLVLQLMALDHGGAVYVGRPCYHGLSRTSACSGVLWTHERYSDAVVTSMEAAVRRLVTSGGVDRLVWFGYSGGGTLAMLLAPRFTETTDVVTIAANLDIDAWADAHKYSRLVGSLNPALQPALPPGIRQRHYVGGNDRVVTRDIVTRGPIDGRTVVVVRDFDHTCCWPAIWPEVLLGVR